MSTAATQDQAMAFDPPPSPGTFTLTDPAALTWTHGRAQATPTISFPIDAPDYD